MGEEHWEVIKKDSLSHKNGRQTSPAPKKVILPE